MNLTVPAIGGNESQQEVRPLSTFQKDVNSDIDKTIYLPSINHVTDCYIPNFQLLSLSRTTGYP